MHTLQWKLLYIDQNLSEHFPEIQIGRIIGSVYGLAPKGTMMVQVKDI